VDNFNITSVNPKFCQVFKYNERDVSSLILKEIFKDSEAYYKFTERLNQKKYVEEFETELLTSEGDVCYCMINAVAVSDENNELIMYQGVIRDMTRRREAEQQLIAAEKLTLTGKLARTIAHEVRNPLTNIRLALDQFKEEMPEDITDADFFLDMISRNTDRISNLITDLMNSSKQRTLELKHYRINDIMEETITLIQDRLKLKEIRYETNFSDNLPLILLDKNQIKIAFINILLNAVEAMVPGKGLLKINTQTRGTYIYTEVIDNGKGISEEEISNIFEPFYTGRKDGSGLGLTTTRNIIHAHKGSIKVASKLGEGTTFQMVFSSEIDANQINTADKI
jgi:PAS domain S-box-containing protein